MALSFVACLPLAAHDFYLLPNAFRLVPGQPVQVAFQNGDSFPESEVAPSLARLKDARLLSAKEDTPIQNLKKEDKRLVGAAVSPQQQGTLLITARTAPHLIELPADKFLAYLKEEGLNEVIDWRSQHGQNSKPGKERYSKYAKSLLMSGASDSYYDHVVGFPLEIMPDEDPAVLRVAGQLAVRVLFRDHPAPGLQIEAAWTANGKSQTKVVGRTDAKGRISIPLSDAGRWRLHSLYMERCSEPGVADWESFWTSMTFEVR